MELYQKVSQKIRKNKGSVRIYNNNNKLYIFIYYMIKSDTFDTLKNTTLSVSKHMIKYCVHVVSGCQRGVKGVTKKIVNDLNSLCFLLSDENQNPFGFEGICNDFSKLVGCHFLWCVSSMISNSSLNFESQELKSDTLNVDFKSNDYYM
jgi:hypothetical protein